MKPGAKIGLSIALIALVCGLAAFWASHSRSRALIQRTFPSAILGASTLANESLTHWHIQVSVNDHAQQACVNLSARVWYGSALASGWLEEHSNEEAFTKLAKAQQTCVFTLGPDFAVVHHPTR